MCVSSLVALAGEGALGWVYTLDLQPKGQAEFEQKIDWTHRQAAGSYGLGLYRSEIEYGGDNQGRDQVIFKVDYRFD